MRMVLRPRGFGGNMSQKRLRLKLMDKRSAGFQISIYQISGNMSRLVLLGGIPKSKGLKLPPSDGNIHF